MHDLKMPLSHPGRSIQAYKRFPEKVVAGSISAVKVVAWRAHRQIEKAAAIVKRHGGPNICVPGELPGFATPGIVAKLARLRDRMEAPKLLAGTGVKTSNLSRRVMTVNQPIANPAADDHHVFVDDRWRRFRVVQFINRPD